MKIHGLLSDDLGMPEEQRGGTYVGEVEDTVRCACLVDIDVNRAEIGWQARRERERDTERGGGGRGRDRTIQAHTLPLDARMCLCASAQVCRLHMCQCASMYTT